MIRASNYNWQVSARSWNWVTSQTYELNATNNEQPEWLVRNVGDISAALQGNHIILCRNHDCYDVFENL